MAEKNEITSDLRSVVDSMYKSQLDEHGRYKIGWTNFQKPGPKGLLKFMWEGSRSRIPDKKELDKNLPVTKPNFSDLNSDKFEHGIWVTWLGHACVLVQMEKIRILTDPVFSSRCGPTLGFQMGPTRFRDAPCSITDLPDINVVVISHNHYDHLDVHTVCDLNKRFGSDLTWLVPKGVKEWMKSMSCQEVIEFDWWEAHTVKDLQFCFVPAMHWSKRGATDDNKTLWGGWCVRGESRSFYFAGDTGYDAGLFKEIGKHLGKFDLAAIPIGAYDPRWFMKCQHIDPQEALHIHEDVRAKKSIGIHWATFNLSKEHYLEPRDKIRELQQRDHTDNAEEVSENDFFTVNPGESKFLD